MNFLDFHLILQSVIDGILIGGIYGLVSIGLTLVFGVMGIINFAQGALMMLGMYTAYWLFSLTGLNPYLGLPIGALVLFAIGALLQRFVLEKTIGAPEHNQLLVTMGLMLIIENTALIVWSPDPRSVNIPELRDSIEMGSFLINKPRGIAFLITVVLTALLFWFLQSTRLGKSIRATSMSQEGAATVGIPVRRINSITFGIGSALAGIAGMLIVPFFYATPTVGSSFVIRAFVVVVLGGLGNFVGALVGGLLIGVTESVGGALTSGTWKELFTFLLFILVLLFRPMGIFGGKGKK